MPGSVVNWLDGGNRPKRRFRPQPACRLAENRLNRADRGLDHHVRLLPREAQRRSEAENIALRHGAAFMMTVHSGRCRAELSVDASH